MPTLVNYSGDDEFYSGCLRSAVDFQAPPSKRARISAPCGEIKQDEKPFIEALPDECLFEILRRLDGAKERSICASVSKKWLMLLCDIRSEEICKTRCAEKVDDSVSGDVEMASAGADEDLGDDGYLTRCLEGKKATDMRLAAIAVGTSSRGGLGKLSIRGNNSICRVSDHGLSLIAHGCPSLRSLSLWNVPSVGDEGLFEIARGCHLLEKLDLCQCPSISNKGLIAIAKNCPNLTALNIESCSKIGDEGLQAVGKLCPKLQSISLKNCPLIGDPGISALFLSAPSIAKVKLQSLNIKDGSLAAIGLHGKEVTSLILGGLSKVTEMGFWVMGKASGLQKLVSLTITSCGGMTDASLESVGKGCANLKQIFLRKSCFISDKGLVVFMNAAGSLESLHLEECNRISQVGIVGALTNGATKLKSLSIIKCLGLKDAEWGLSMPSPSKTLRSLSIRYCPGFGSSGLAMVGKLCPQLQYLDLSGLYGITDDALLPLLDYCEAGLKKVNLSGCLNLTDEAFLALSRTHGGNIEMLNLDGCRKVTDVSLISIANNCFLLEDLDVSKSAITDSGVAALSTAKLHTLRVLSISGCSNVTNESKPYLKKLGKNLDGLNLQYCSSISSRTVDDLLESLVGCDILS